MNWRLILLIALFFSPLASAGDVTEFCLDGELDLGARYQGKRPASGESYPTTWCVVTEANSQRVFFTGRGRSNPDMDGSWSVAYLPPDTVRIVNRESPPDVEFYPTKSLDEALRVRRIDPRRILEEYRESPQALGDARVAIGGDKVMSVRTTADLPLRGRVKVEWNWDWTNAQAPILRLMLDDTLLFKATGRWRDLEGDEAEAVWARTPGAAPVEVPGDRWPATIDMQLIELTDNVHLVRGVRTGFQHLVVETGDGLVVADAPAGWVEFHHIPPYDLVPGLGVSGLSERLIDFLHEKFPTRPIRAVAITHFHDDHAGGARAFAAAGAEIFVTSENLRFFQTALNRSSMPDDRLSERATLAVVLPVDNPVILGGEPSRVKLVRMGPGPHVDAMLGVFAMDEGYFFVSDVHVPRSDADTPRKERAVTECWFARWAVNNLAPEVQVVNSHSTPITPVTRLEKYLDSDTCVDM
jgi:glyoxylase-like metal-dependent hydrolase (beta-lactamase superfamily II)